MRLVKGTAKTVLKYFDLAILAGLLLSIAVIFSFIYFQQTESSASTVHTFNLIVSSAVFWCYLFLYLAVYQAIRHRLINALVKQISDIDDIENWLDAAGFADKPEPLLVDNKIADYIRAMQLELSLAQKGHSLFDQELRENALLDPHTRIGNRDSFTNHLVALLKEDDCRGSVFLIQLKGCELIKNLYGESHALRLLQSAIDSIKNRIFDIPDCFLSRRAEFELAILTPSLFVDESEKLAERILKNLTSLPMPVGVNKEEFCHIGISYFKYGRAYFQVMSEADMALRSAQLQGPAQWFMYDPGEVAKESALGSLKWRTFLSQVIENKSFIIFSQPVLKSGDNQVLHYEVLSKIQASRGKLISPRIFLPMAEKCGLSSQLDLVVFEQVCQLILAEKKHHSYSLNFSIEAILSADFRRELFKLSHKYANVANKVIIEISEYHLKSRLNELIPVIADLKSKGFTILADKVGQYVVNGQYLKQCQVSYVKLHRSIVIDIDKKPENQVFVQSIKVLCEPLNISLFAVGIETLEEWQTLNRIGVCGGQGHYFNEPVAQLVNAIG